VVIFEDLFDNFPIFCGKRFIPIFQRLSILDKRRHKPGTSVPSMPLTQVDRVLKCTELFAWIKAATNAVADFLDKWDGTKDNIFQSNHDQGETSFEKVLEIPVLPDVNQGIIVHDFVSKCSPYWIFQIESKVANFGVMFPSQRVAVLAQSIQPSDWMTNRNNGQDRSLINEFSIFGEVLHPSFRWIMFSPKREKAKVRTLAGNVLSQLYNIGTHHGTCHGKNFFSRISGGGEQLFINNLCKTFVPFNLSRLLLLVYLLVLQ
jgi:hypothetical protein